MLSKFLDPKNNFAFRKIFGYEKNKDILIHFLNDMITFKERSPIESLTFLKTNQDPEIAHYRNSSVDILCKDKNGNTYIVQMKVAKEKGFEKRAQCYASKAYISQVRIGGEYQDLKEVIFLAISDFIIFPNKNEYKSDHVILDRESHENDLKDFSFTFIELPKFNKSEAELSSNIDQWIYFIKNAENLEVIPDQIEDEGLKKAYLDAAKHNWTKLELDAYDYVLMREQDERGRMTFVLNKSKKEIAINFLKVGLSVEDTAQGTGLPTDQVQKLIST